MYEIVTLEDLELVSGGGKDKSKDKKPSTPKAPPAPTAPAGKSDPAKEITCTVGIPSGISCTGSLDSFLRFGEGVIENIMETRAK